MHYFYWTHILGNTTHARSEIKNYDHSIYFWEELNSLELLNVVYKQFSCASFPKTSSVCIVFRPNETLVVAEYNVWNIYEYVLNTLNNDETKNKKHYEYYIKCIRFDKRKSKWGVFIILMRIWEKKTLKVNL